MEGGKARKREEAGCTPTVPRGRREVFLLVGRRKEVPREASIRNQTTTRPHDYDTNNVKLEYVGHAKRHIVSWCYFSSPCPSMRAPLLPLPLPTFLHVSVVVFCLVITLTSLVRQLSNSSSIVHIRGYLWVFVKSAYAPVMGLHRAPGPDEGPLTGGGTGASPQSHERVRATRRPATMED